MLILCCCICSIFGSWFTQRSKSWEKLLSISIPYSFRGHPGLAKYRTVWTTFSRYFLWCLSMMPMMPYCSSSDAFSLTCTIWIVSAYVRYHGHFLANYKPQQLDCRENWIYAYRICQLFHPCKWLLYFTFPHLIDKCVADQLLASWLVIAL